MKKKYFRHALVLFVLGLFFNGCSVKNNNFTEYQNLEKKYKEAVTDAKTAEYSEISYDLIDITPFNSKIKWNKNKTMVLAVTWTSWDGYDNMKNQELKIERDVWVTIVPQIKNFCKQLDLNDKKLSLRLEQVLGVPPDNGKTKFAEIWVSPHDLFRPSPDPEIDDRQAQINYPVSETFIKISKEHVEWMNALKKTSYGDNGYPWTRLGYTYDWGNPHTEVGLSEFVIKKGATVKINKVFNTSNYCN